MTHFHDEISFFLPSANIYWHFRKYIIFYWLSCRIVLISTKIDHFKKSNVLKICFKMPSISAIFFWNCFIDEISLFLVIFIVLISTLSDINKAVPTFLQLVILWDTFSHLFYSYLSFFVFCFCFYRKYIVQFFFLIKSYMFLIGIFRPFIFNITIDIIDLNILTWSPLVLFFFSSLTYLN